MNSTIGLELNEEYEDLRLAKLYELEILDSDQEPTFNSIVEIACTTFGCKQAIIAFADKHRNFIKAESNNSYYSRVRLEASSTWIDKIRNPEPVYVSDNSAELNEVRAVFGDDINTMVISPITTWEGFVMGSLVVTSKQTLTIEEIRFDILASLAKLLMEQLTLRHSAKQALTAHFDFVNQTVHDLKNPLANIKLSAQIIQGQTLPPSETKSFCDTIVRSVGKATLRLETLLSISRFETDSFILDSKELNLSGIVQSVIRTLSLLSKSKDQAIIFSGPETSLICGDAERVEEIVENLITNALKFSEKGLTIDVEVLQNPTNCTVKVKDSGQGLNSKDLESLFTRFSKLSSRPTAMESSHGLGLFIVKTLVELHKGTVWAESSGKGLGSTFFVSFPRFKKKSN